MTVITPIDGQKLHVVVAGWLTLMENAFRARFNLELYVSSGYRTTAEQRAIFLARYRVQATGNGPYNDVRWYEGKRWVRHSAAGTVAVPGTSLHESHRAVDIRDSGRDAGVTVKGTVRSNWIRDNASKYGFRASGLGFGEPWHIDFTGSLQPYNTTHMKSVRAELRRLGYSVASDGLIDLEVYNATKAFQKAAKLTVDGLPGGGTLTKLKATPTPKPPEPEPEPIKANERVVVFPQGARRRSGPTTKSETIEVVLGNTKVSFDGYVMARYDQDEKIELVDGSSIWFVDGAHFFHSSGFTNKTTDGLSNLTEDRFPLPPVIPDPPVDPPIDPEPEPEPEDPKDEEPEVPDPDPGTDPVPVPKPIPNPFVTIAGLIGAAVVTIVTLVAAFFSK